MGNSDLRKITQITQNYANNASPKNYADYAPPTLLMTPSSGEEACTVVRRCLCLLLTSWEGFGTLSS